MINRQKITYKSAAGLLEWLIVTDQGLTLVSPIWYNGFEDDIKNAIDLAVKTLKEKAKEENYD